MKKWLAIGLKAGVSGGLIWYLLSGINFASLKSHLTDVQLDFVALAVITVLLQAVIGGLRWGAVLNGLRAGSTYLFATRLFYIGMFFNQALPGGTGGDAVRMYVARREGLSLRHAINGVLIERVAAVIALVALVDITQPMFMSKLSEEAAQLSIVGVVGMTVAMIIGVIFLSQLDRLPEAMRKWRVVRGLGHLGSDVRTSLFSVPRAAPLIFWSFLGHINISLSVYLLAVALDLDVTFLDCLILIPPVLLILTVPISIGGWGVREGAIVWAFALVGVPNEAALVLSLLFGVTVLCVSLPGGLVWLMSRDKQSGEPIIPKDGMRELQDSQENA